ncbi:MAG: two-component hybrid sensor and regulator [Sphingomonadales bacterium]|nr:two-component hybrid sensor and regulator [Sphingomonadales bacterium]
MQMLRAEIAALEKAKDVAESANDAKTRYLVAVSHEIRSPLNAIYGYSQLLERGDVVKPADAARVIRRSSEHLANLVEGLLEISRVESGLIRIARETVPFLPLFEQLIDMFRSQAAEKGIALNFVHDGRLPAFVRTDEKRLRQIIINLLSNAIKYTDHGFTELRIAYRSQTAIIEVIDSGVGIRAEDRETIFEPFERGGSPEALSRPGIGLGLAITRTLARIMGGELTVQSEPGQGSRFTLRLMLPEPMEAPLETARSRTITGYEGNRRTLLLVDDDPAQQDILSGLFRSLGFTVFAGANGQEGLDLAAQVAPDLALLDIQMQGMSGWQVATELRAIHAPALKIVMVSANALEFSAGGDGKASHDAFVMKPVDLNLLLDVVATQLGLVWTAQPVQQVNTVTHALSPDAAPFIAELKRLGSIGHARGITEQLDQMAAALPDMLPLVTRLRGRADAFDMKAFLHLLGENSRG